MHLSDIDAFVYLSYYFYLILMDLLKLMDIYYVFIFKVQENGKRKWKKKRLRGDLHNMEDDCFNACA